MAVDYLPQKLAPFDIQAVLRRTNGKPGLVRKMIMFPGSSWVLERPRYLAISSLSQANDSVSSLCSDDMVGAVHADKVALVRLSLGRQGRDAVLNIEHPVTVSRVAL
jgi:hypothetical protein